MPDYRHGGQREGEHEGTLQLQNGEGIGSLRQETDSDMCPSQPRRLPEDGGTLARAVLRLRACEWGSRVFTTGGDYVEASLGTASPIMQDVGKVQGGSRGQKGKT